MSVKDLRWYGGLLLFVLGNAGWAVSSCGRLSSMTRYVGFWMAVIGFAPLVIWCSIQNSRERRACAAAEVAELRLCERCGRELPK